MKFEVCIDSVQSAINAEEAGAHRVELCDNLIEGGTTPSAGMIKQVILNTKNLDTYVIIRPRGGHFMYSKKEIDVMLADIEIALNLGVKGIVSGALTSDGEIDLKTTKMLISACKGKPFTFHRAFDLCNNPLLALEQIIDLGAARILTSGQEPTAEQGIELIKQLVTSANGRISIMPGSGIRPNNAKMVAQMSKAIDFHFSARKKTSTKAQIIDTNRIFEAPNGLIHNEVFYSDKETIKAIIKNIENLYV